MEKKVKFTIYPSKWNDDGYTYCKIQDLSKQLQNCWDYFLHEQKDDIEITFDDKKITVSISSYYCIVMNDLLFIRRRCPQCLKMGKRATAFLDGYTKLMRR